ncbi:hypothetical protein [Leptospira kirschneri]|uniref:hypothetical protein n=1 Tax=Leptospira kirschneri TaxID=29507 RepID=UPI0002784D32|nr:hypothetical protein [Leptospira kirschneri]EJO68511.1 hypothetical protein LEP1GSC044_1019 [Leptospira kirschneri serovar Grippotyphosa str. RM52]EMN27744.1 hypothetical protein LEP1GSC065_0010 [Leptospira kirschneri serovar Sokoine str. RM1]WBF94056.1 hypothetical protein LIX31_13940 [Leptospira kirschneri]
MGTWGPEVYENDQALDLYYEEIKRLVDEVEKVLAAEPVAFDDLEGPLLYIHMLLLLVQDHELPGLDRTTVDTWKKKYLHIFDSTIGSPEEDYVTKRREVIHREFDSLSAKLQK